MNLRLPTVCLLASAILLATAACRSEPEEEAPPVEPAEEIDPRPISGITKSADGVTIAYHARGHGEPALVFVHGWSCDQRYWPHQVEDFSADHRVVTLDLAGHGESGFDRLNWTLGEFGEDVKAVVEELELQRVILIGHSMGGPVVLEAASRMPETVLGVIAVDALHDAAFEHDQEEWDAWTAAHEQDFDASCRRFVSSLFVESTRKAVVDQVTADMCSSPPEVAIPLLNLLPRFDAKQALREAAVPIRAINADSFPTNVEGNRSFAPDYGAVVMEGVGHFPMLERPEEFNRHLRAAVAEVVAAGRT